MKTYKLKLDIEYEEECYKVLEERFGRQNQIAENEFWDNIKISEVK